MRIFSSEDSLTKSSIFPWFSHRKLALGIFSGRVSLTKLSISPRFSHKASSANKTQAKHKPKHFKKREQSGKTPESRESRAPKNRRPNLTHQITHQITINQPQTDCKSYLSNDFIVGNSRTSRIAGELVNNMVNLSIPYPMPPVGAIPSSSALRKSSSVWLASSSPRSAKAS